MQVYGLMTTPSFIDKHGLWTDDQRRRAEELKLFLEKDKLQFVLEIGRASCRERVSECV